jgi:aspartyl-tRNA(Asn)/glutamyl-tRNA(Gln) amidotransferase subunit B
MTTNNEWETVIGLEIHAQLSTNSKIFSGASIAFGAEPNTQACFIDLGFPGVLPVLNAACVEMAIKLGLGINAEITKKSVFARKNYFYPDLPKGYQISQFELPIVGKGGYMDIPLEGGTSKRINITRAHLEEDAGKSLHENFEGQSGIDLNRAGTPLLEIVSEPDMSSAKEAVAYLKALHSLVRYLGICDGNMQEGSFRCDANVSVRRKGEKLGTRAELKNINSFRFVERAINYEVERQIELIESGGRVVQETRLYDPGKNETRSMRSKEEANDYRYFPDPDLLPLIITDEQIEKVRAELPELPHQKRQRFVEKYEISSYDAIALSSSRSLADYYEAVVSESGNQPKLAANWVMGELSAALNKTDADISDSPVSSAQLGKLIQRIADNTISGKIAKTIFEALWNGESDVDQIIEKQGLKQVTDTGAIEALIDKIIAANPQQVADYRSGKDKLFGFFVGQAMKESGGKMNPQQLNDLLKKKLSND